MNFKKPHTIPPTAPTTTKGVFDYLLDDAAVYAVFNHQIADLPNPQSPYKKDNPKTWGDGVLIDFGDGTAGIAKSVTFNQSAKKQSLEIYVVNSAGKFGDIISYGGSLNLKSPTTGANVSFPLGAFNYYEPNTLLIVTPDTTRYSNREAISFDFVWQNGEIASKPPETVWMWVIVEYHA